MAFVVSDEDKFVILQKNVMELSEKLKRAEERIATLESLTPTSSPEKVGHSPVPTEKDVVDVEASAAPQDPGSDPEEEQDEEEPVEEEPVCAPVAAVQEQPAPATAREEPPSQPAVVKKRVEPSQKQEQRAEAKASRKGEKKQAAKESKPKPTQEWWEATAKKTQQANPTTPATTVSVDWTGVLVALLSAAVYSNSLWGEMVFDDRMAIKQNRDVIRQVVTSGGTTSGGCP